MQKWHSSTGSLKPVSEEAKHSKPTSEPVDRVTFLGEVFKDIKPTQAVGRILMQNPETVPADSLKLALKWAQETGLGPLQAALMAEITMKDPTETNITEAARNLVFAGAEFHESPVISGYLFQQGKILIDKGMSMNDKNIALRNALITYISEYENEPMKFLGVLRETLQIDSNNVETHFIHLNLLKKSGQWEKAIKKCEKLISLQPENSMWLYQASDLYGYTGDSVNAKLYLNLAVKAQKSGK